jgi:catechol 2,3-dioxygenase-like lactoylglutathione lyase family enzyme
VSRVIGLDHIVLKVSDLEQAADFYVRVCAAERIELSYGRIGLRVGANQINLHGPGSTPHPLPVDVPGPGSADLCFMWDGSPESAYEYVREQGIEPELGPVPRTGARGSGQSVYFRDPDGNLLELITY